MRRPQTWIAFGAVVAAIVPPVTAVAKGFHYGVTVGDVSSTEALVWTRADAPGDVTLEVSSQSHFPAGAVTTYAATARRASDNTITIRVSGLTPGSRYFYRFRRPGGTSVVGQFETAPKPSQTRTITFAYSGDADAQPAKGQTKPFFNHFQAYAQMAREGNDFNINLGDTIYSDSLVQSTAPHGVLHLAFPPALSRKAKWAKYRMNLGLFNLRRVRRSAAMYDQWDDHEFVNDFTPAEMGQKLYRAGRDAFRDYMPAPYSKEDGIYRTVRWGKNVQLFFPDERSFRSAKASAHHVCDNPQTHQPDVAPTLPPSKRALFSVLVPQLKAPVSKKCLATINSSKRTFLGRHQLTRLEKDLMRSTSTFKIIVNEVPILQQYISPYDQWEGYAYERGKFLTFLKNHVKNVLFISTDIHAVLVSDARLKTLEPGGPVDTGIFDFVTGPVATETDDVLLAKGTGDPNTGDEVRSAFYKPPPPNGIGMPCANLNVYSYTEVKVTSNAVTLTPKDLRGKQVQDKNKSDAAGPPCGPFTIKRK